MQPLRPSSVQAMIARDDEHRILPSEARKYAVALGDGPRAIKSRAAYSVKTTQVRLWAGMVSVRVTVWEGSSVTGWGVPPSTVTWAWAVSPV